MRLRLIACFGTPDLACRSPSKIGIGKSAREMRVTSAPACASSAAMVAASFALSEPVRSEPGITRIFSADMIEIASGQDRLKARSPKDLATAPTAPGKSSALAIHPDTGRRKVHPYPLGGFCGNARQRFRNRRRHRIGELHERRTGRQRQEGVADQF